ISGPWGRSPGRRSMRLRLLPSCPARTDKRPRCRFAQRRRRLVMRALSAVLGLAVALSVCSAEAKDQPGAAAGSVQGIQGLNLTDAQEARIADIQKECQPKVQQAAKELATVVKEEVEKIRAVLTAEQKEKLQTLKEDREERREGCLGHRIARLKELDLTDAE